MQSKNAMRAKALKGTGFRSGKEALAAIEWEEMSSEVRQAVKKLLSGRDELRAAHRRHIAKSAGGSKGKEMTFALDGRLVGDIGELIAAVIFDLDLMGTKEKNVDAVTRGPYGRRVQIKATFGTGTLSMKHGGDYSLALQLSEKGQFRVIYNGPASEALKYLKLPKANGHGGRQGAGKNLEPISLSAWAALDLGIDRSRRIKRKQVAGGR